MEFSQEWVCTDPDQNQWGRQLTEELFEFKSGNKEAILIDLMERGRQLNEIEHCINPFGYTLQRGDNKLPSLENIHELYGDKAKWIIAECLFESNC